MDNRQKAEYLGVPYHTLYGWVKEYRRKLRSGDAEPIKGNLTDEVQYTSADYWDETTGILKSYSSKANSWDNACIESFHALIKREWLNRF